ncbi:ABC transporter permease [Kordiimonas laminariae]|uniref:ABC transporter permease n=1 Tax=Kordiimonas laminariae TaxID=2917717 RepID=UPI001FF52604|nr:FtsX-like permease family protein [Kordiimonas laminariae]MCK0068990.1 hypothetical protein [Kordiimonas laminariae]
MSTVKLIWDNARHDLKAADGRITVLTQTALLFFLLTLTLVSASIQNYLKANLDQMLGSDVVVESHVPLEDRALQTLRSETQGLAKSELLKITLSFEKRWERVQLKLVDNAYPIQGQLMIGASPGADQMPAKRGPDIGDIWLGSRLATKLGAGVGDQIKIGGENLQVAQILFHEPDRLMEGHSVDLRAMVHMDSLASSALASSGQRFRYMMMADEAQAETIETWAKDALPGATVLKKYGGQHPLSGFWRRTENFLGLASVILFFMAAVAIDMTNRRWLANMRYRIAIYTSFGTSLGKSMAMAGGQWLTGFVLSTVGACVFAAVAQDLIVAELQAYFPGLSGGLYLAAIIKTVALVFILLLALQIPTFNQLRGSSVLSLIRKAPENRYLLQRLFWGLTSATLLAAVYSDNMLLTAMTLGAVAVALIFMTFLSWLVLRLGDYWGSRRAGLLPFAFFMMRQRIFSKSAQILGLGLCGLLLLFSLMLMRDFSAMIETNSRVEEGNLIISEAQEKHVGAIHDWSEKTGSTVKQLRPFLSAKLVQVNGVLLNDYMKKPSDSLATLQEPIRLSWADEIPDNNRLVDGNRWEVGTEDWQQISAEPEVMTDMGFKFGDKLTYQIGGETYTFTLVASHAYKPGGSFITFWFQVPLSAREQIKTDTYYMGSMNLPEQAWSELASLWEANPTLALLPLKEMMQRLEKTLGIVTKVTSGYAAMVLVLSLFVVAASVSGFKADDQQKNGLLMSMGLKEKDCLWLNFYDWGVTALIAAAGAIVGTWMAGILIYEDQFGLFYNPDPIWVVGTISLMVGTVCLIGYLACRQSLKVSVRDLLAG